jgi:hypothetical protein
VASFPFLKQDAPFYQAGYSAIISTTVVGVAAFLVYGGLVWKERRQAARLSVEGKPVEVLSL